MDNNLLNTIMAPFANLHKKTTTHQNDHWHSLFNIKNFSLSNEKIIKNKFKFDEIKCIDNVQFNDLFNNSLTDSSSITMPQSIKNDPRLYKDDIDIEFSRTLNSCKLPQIRYASIDRLFERLTDLRFLSIDFLNTFLLTYRVFTDGVTVLEALKKVHYNSENFIAQNNEVNQNSSTESKNNNENNDPQNDYDYCRRVSSFSVYSEQVSDRNNSITPNSKLNNHRESLVSTASSETNNNLITQQQLLIHQQLLVNKNSQHWRLSHRKFEEEKNKRKNSKVLIEPIEKENIKTFTSLNKIKKNHKEQSKIKEIKKKLSLVEIKETDINESCEQLNENEKKDKDKLENQEIKHDEISEKTKVENLRNEKNSFLNLPLNNNYLTTLSSPDYTDHILPPATTPVNSDLKMDEQSRNLKLDRNNIKDSSDDDDYSTYSSKSDNSSTTNSIEEDVLLDLSSSEDNLDKNDDIKITSNCLLKKGKINSAEKVPKNVNFVLTEIEKNNEKKNSNESSKNKSLNSLDINGNDCFNSINSPLLLSSTASSITLVGSLNNITPPEEIKNFLKQIKKETIYNVKKKSISAQNTPVKKVTTFNTSSSRSNTPIKQQNQINSNNFYQPHHKLSITSNTSGNSFSFLKIRNSIKPSEENQNQNEIEPTNPSPRSSFQLDSANTRSSFQYIENQQISSKAGVVITSSLNKTRRSSSASAASAFAVATAASSNPVEPILGISKILGNLNIGANNPLSNMIGSCGSNVNSRSSSRVPSLISNDSKILYQVNLVNNQNKNLLAQAKINARRESVINSAATMRVLNVLRHWISKHFQDFEKDSKLLELTCEFLEDLTHDSNLLPPEHKVASQLLQMITKEEGKASIDAGLSFLVKQNDLNSLLKIQDVVSKEIIDTFKPLEIAENMTYLDHKIFISIHSCEFLCQAWMKTDTKDTKAPSISLMTKRFNEMSKTVVSEIILANDLNERVIVIKKWIDVAKCCWDLHNFNGVLQICSALTNSSVFRLKRTWEKIDKTQKNNLEKLQKLIATDGRFRNMRDALHCCDPPCIPYLGMYLADLTLIEEGTPNYTENGLLNFSKMRMIAHVVREVRTFQQTPYKLEMNQKIINYLLDTTKHLSDDELYYSSLKLEPRLSRFGTRLNSVAGQSNTESESQDVKNC